jgi:hypothetical protein
MVMVAVSFPVQRVGQISGWRLANRERRREGVDRRRKIRFIESETRGGFHASFGRGDPCTQYSEKKIQDAGLRPC